MLPEYRHGPVLCAALLCGSMTPYSLAVACCGKVSHRGDSSEAGLSRNLVRRTEGFLYDSIME